MSEQMLKLNKDFRVRKKSQVLLSQNRLLSAISTNDILNAALAIRELPNLDFFHGDMPVLCIAVKERCTEIAELLVNSGANVKLQRIVDAKISRFALGKTDALTLAIDNGDAYLAKILIQNGSLVNPLISTDPLYLLAAVSSGYADIVKLLLDAGAEIDHVAYAKHDILTSAIIHTRKTTSYDVLDLILDRLKYTNNLHYLVNVVSTGIKYRCAPAIAYLLTKYPELSYLLTENQEDGSTILGLSLTKSMSGLIDRDTTHLLSDMLRVLIEHDVDINKAYYLDEKYGKSHILFKFAGSKKAKQAQCLLEHGVDFNHISSKGYTALDVALEQHCWLVVASLLDLGASLDTPVRGGLTPRKLLTKYLQKEENHYLVEFFGKYMERSLYTTFTQKIRSIWVKYMPHISKKSRV